MPQIVKEIVSASSLFSSYGIGAISGKKFPLYAGRWVDPLTGVMRAIPKMKSKFLNPASY